VIGAQIDRLPGSWQVQLSSQNMLFGIGLNITVSLPASIFPFWRGDGNA